MFYIYIYMILDGDVKKCKYITMKKNVIFIWEGEVS
jgi:hypothetical protein